jgi:hypothetical protein
MISWKEGLYACLLNIIESMSARVSIEASLWVEQQVEQ